MEKLLNIHCLFLRSNMTEGYTCVRGADLDQDESASPKTIGDCPVGRTPGEPCQEVKFYPVSFIIREKILQTIT